MNKIAYSPTPVDLRHCSISVTQAIKKTVWIVLITGMLCSCGAPAIKASNAELDKLESVLVVAVEAPPLEIAPDPVESRIPAYGHFRNMAIAVDLEKRLYRKPSGILIAGLVDGDELRTLDASLQAPSPGAIGAAWTPTRALAEIAHETLSRHWIHSALSRNYRPLPLTEAERNAELSHWQFAIQDWYALEGVTADYAGLRGFDAVLEVGVAKYRIFEGQLSLAVMLKLINPNTGRLIARTRVDAFETDGRALRSLATDGEIFRQRIADLGENLLNQAFDRLGWRLEPMTYPLSRR
ncbi:hypothetical protein [Methylomonas sp. MgM2]